MSNHNQNLHISHERQIAIKKTVSHSRTHTPETQIGPSCFKLNDTAFHWDIIDGSYNILKIFKETLKYLIFH